MLRFQQPFALLNVLIFFLCFLSVSQNFSFISDSLKNIENSTDYIVISPTSFFNTLKPLIQYRENHGLEVFADLQRVSTEFQDTFRNMLKV